MALRLGERVEIERRAGDVLMFEQRAPASVRRAQRR